MAECVRPFVAPVAKLVDAPDLGSGGRPWGFESLYPHQTKTIRAFQARIFLLKFIIFNFFCNKVLAQGDANKITGRFSLREELKFCFQKFEKSRLELDCFR